jgi:hypothetical protein
MLFFLSCNGIIKQENSLANFIIMCRFVWCFANIKQIFVLGTWYYMFLITTLYTVSQLRITDIFVSSPKALIGKSNAPKSMSDILAWTKLLSFEEKSNLKKLLVDILSSLISIAFSFSTQKKKSISQQFPSLHWFISFHKIIIKK